MTRADDWGETIRGSWVLLTLAAIGIAFAVWSGHHWHKASGAYDVGLAAAVGTAVGTALLAFATYRLSLQTAAMARTTGDDVRATQRLAEMAFEDQELRDKPEIQITSAGSNNDGISLHVMNLGNGPARWLRIYRCGGIAAKEEPIQTVDLVAVDERKTVTIALAKLAGKEHKPDIWDFAYMNRWRTWHYESRAGYPIEAERVVWVKLGETPLGKGRLA